MSELFYRAFEDRYRGSRELIKSRLAVYTPFLTPLLALGARPAALDLGCGRGEWLELLGEAGFAAHGVDLDEGMLAACRERELDVELTDALGSLRARADASVALVSAFHLVEHIPFDQVQALIAEARRVLQPGGLLILETPNPENLVVGSSSFYMDPSHLRPLPAPLLAFAVDHSGYARHKVLRLQEAQQLHGDAPIGLINVLDGVSPDYAVIGQKTAPAELLATFDTPFAASYGIALSDLAQRYETQEDGRRAELHRMLDKLDQEFHLETATTRVSLDSVHRGVARVAGGVESNARRLDKADQSLLQLEQHNQQVLQQLEQRLAQQIAQAEARLTQGEERLAQGEARQAQAEQRAVQAEQEAALQRQHIAALLASSSWRITAPLRLVAGTAYRLRGAVRDGRVLSGIKRRVKPLLLDLARATLRRPRLKRVARNVLGHFPGVQARLQRMLYQAASAPAPLEAASAPPAPPANLSDLSPRALRMYRDLQRSIAARKN
ncbi:MAG: methyltransferase domain-containing protein [Pseudomonadota bacterium]